MPEDPRGVLSGGTGLLAPPQGSAAVRDAEGLGMLEMLPGTQGLLGNNDFLRGYLSASLPLSR